MAAGMSRDMLSTTIVGRTSELDQLGGCLARIREGNGAAVVIGGEAGVGKTLLVNQLCSVARCVSGSCYGYSATPPYGPWLEALDDLRRQSVTPGDTYIPVAAIWGAAQDEHAILAGVLQELTDAARKQPLVVILEDMHWADDASVRLLHALLRHIQHHALLIAVTYRDDDLAPTSPLHSLLPYLLRDGGAERIHLQRLDPHATNEIVARRYDLSEDECLRLGSYLQKRAQGNPFFTMELLFALEEQNTLRMVNGKWQISEIGSQTSSHPLPALVRQVIDGRLARLSDTTRRLLQIAAVIGQDVPVALWRSLSEVDEHAFAVGVERAMAARFIQEAPQGRSVVFRHALVREAIYLSVVLPDRHRLHCLAAEEMLKDPQPDAERVAYHFTRAMDRRAVEWLALAADRALGLYAPHAAIDHCNVAVELSASLSSNVPSAIFRTRGNAYATIGAFPEALRDLTECLERARRQGDPSGEWQALHDLGQLWSVRDYSRSRECFGSALSLARELKDDHRLAHSLNRVGNWYLNDDQPAEAIRLHQEALAIFERETDMQSVAQTSDLLGMSLLILGDLVAAGKVLQDAIGIFEALDDRVGLCSAIGTFVTTAGSNGFDHLIPIRVPARNLEQFLDRALALARETFWHSGETYTLSVIGSHHLIRGNYSQALQAFIQATALAEEIGHREWTSYAVSGIADTYLGLLQAERAREYAERALVAARSGGSEIHENGARASLSRVYLAGGDVQPALEVLKVGDENRNSWESSIRQFCRIFEAQARLRSGDPEVALELIDRLIAASLNSDLDQYAPILGRVRAEALIDMHRFREAESELVAAGDLASELGYRPEVWRIKQMLGTVYLNQHRPGDARRSFSESRTVIEQLAGSLDDAELGGHFLENALSTFPDASGLSPMQAARQESGGLTPRQRDVAVLVARGKTNAAISNELSISERTVEGHVSAIMATLNFTSRTQIAAWAVDRQLVSL